jgi:ADP-ribosylglycohydrolase
MQGSVAQAMRNAASIESQANGSLMRISPLAIYGYQMTPDELFALARQESLLTHPNPVCAQCCGLFCVAVAYSIRTGESPVHIYEAVMRFAGTVDLDPAVSLALHTSASARPESYKGWVIASFQNAFYQLLHSNSFEEGVVDTVMQGGDTDTHGAIAGALLGAVYGREAIPFSWRSLVLSCRPHQVTGAANPRPWAFWPVDLLNLAELFLELTTHDSEKIYFLMLIAFLVIFRTLRL